MKIRLPLLPKFGVAGRLLSAGAIAAALAGMAAPGFRMLDAAAFDAGGERPCDVTIRGSNSGASTITFGHSMSRVKVRGGLWKKLGSWEATAKPDGSLASTVRLDFGCSPKRRYRLYFARKDGSDAVCYYPSSASWTTRTTLNLGDLANYFEPDRSTSSC